MPDERWEFDEMLRLARKGVRRVDEQGTRGITLVNHEEIAAMAAVIVLSGALNQLAQEAETLGEGT